jgi:formylglycine-generating enzyme
MRKNPYLKDEQEFRPLLMRASFGNNFLNTNAQTRQELVDLTLGISKAKETYTLNGISFDMVRTPLLNTNGTLRANSNIQMCSTECTQGLFEEVMGFNYSDFKGKTDSATRPIENVTWFDCIVFCNKLSEMLGYAPYYHMVGIKYGEQFAEKSIMSAEVNIIGGNGFRLPTDEEWLAFAKAETDNRWPGNNNEGELVDYAWYDKNSGGETHPVATKKPNEWGMYDMSGNVWEWVWDREYITDRRTLAPRIIRGGGRKSGASNLYSASWFKDFPNDRDHDLGFRVARTKE